jgi:transposase
VDLVVFEACTLAGWVFDLCRDLQVQAQVANTNGEAWKWKNGKRKTDKDDALKLARLAALGQLPEMRLPTKSVREKRALLSYRQGLVGRRVAVQNRIRAVLLRRL